VEPARCGKFSQLLDRLRVTLITAPGQTFHETGRYVLSAGHDQVICMVSEETDVRAHSFRD
jgi:hypothetical protein